MTQNGKNVYENFNYSMNAVETLDTRDEDIDWILNHYNVTRKSMEEIIQNIKDWYKKQPHLPQGQLHDRMILAHLITRGFSVEQSKEKIDNYFSARHKMPDLLCDRDLTSPLVDKYLRRGFWTAPRLKTKEHYRIILFRIPVPEDLIFTEVIKMGLLFIDYRLFNETTIGDHCIVDLTNLRLQHVIQITPVLMYKIYYHMTSCYAAKIKGIHLVNVPAYAQTLISTAKKLMKNKHIERLHIYDSFEDLYKVLPKELFPKDLGGGVDTTCDEIAELWRTTIQSETWKKYFDHQNKHFFTDESKRPESSKIDSVFGVEGSFRKLDLD